MSRELETALHPVYEIARALRACADLVAGDGSIGQGPASLGMVLQEDAICLFSVLSNATMHAHDELQRHITAPLRKGKDSP